MKRRTWRATRSSGRPNRVGATLLLNLAAGLGVEIGHTAARLVERYDVAPARASFFTPAGEKSHPVGYQAAAAALPSRGTL
jgi:hypothetical protein